jgi:hypothetical protein
MQIEEILKTRVDSFEYEILTNAIKQTKGLEGATCEIGVREGGSSFMIMDTLLKNQDKCVHIGIDPFGDIDYIHRGEVCRADYTNKMKQKMLKEIYEWCYENDMEFLFFPLEDTEFFERFADGVPTYNRNKTLINTYKAVFFDGPHDEDIVKKEINFFDERMAIGGVMIFDDIYDYPHMETLDQYIKDLNFETLEQGSHRKISYIKKSRYKI